MKKHTVLVMKEHSDFLIETDLELESLQKLVGGYIEMPYLIPELYEKGILLVIDDEGKFKSDNYINFVLTEKSGEIIDTVMGDVVFVRDVGEGEIGGLEKGDFEYIISLFSEKVKVRVQDPDTKEIYPVTIKVVRI